MLEFLRKDDNTFDGLAMFLFLFIAEEVGAQYFVNILYYFYIYFCPYFFFLIT